MHRAISMLTRLPPAALLLCESLYFCNSLRQFVIYTPGQKVDITEGASAQFPTWIFNFWPYGQLRAVRGKINYELWATLSSVFSCFHGQKYCSVRTKKLLDIRMRKNINFFWKKKYKLFFLLAPPSVLNPECKSRGRFCYISFVHRVRGFKFVLNAIYVLMKMGPKGQLI